MDLGKILIKRFADGEIYVQLQESVRGCDVFLIQPTCSPVNENLMELFIMIDACRRASARSITVVIPYFGYARADRKVLAKWYSDLVYNLVSSDSEFNVKYWKNQTILKRIAFDFNVFPAKMQIKATPSK